MEIIKKAERIEWKAEIANRAPEEARRWQIKEYRRCIEDKIYWFNNYLWAFDPNKTPSIVPFILWDHEIRLLNQLDKLEDLFIDKSREMGVTWTIMGWELHNNLYVKGFTALNISRKETEVQDTGNTYHSLHGRLSFMYQRLPPFLKPQIHNPYLTFSVPSMNSVIKGESANPNAGRDSQYKFIFIDEAAFIECLDDMYKGVRNATRALCLVSTPPKANENNKFAEIKEMKNSTFIHMSFHWKEHPEKNDEWYKRKTSSMNEQEIAQELEIGYDKAKINRSYAEYDDRIHLLGHKVYLNPKSKVYCFMDFGLDGEVFLFSQKDFENRLFFIYYKIFKDMLTSELYLEFLKCLDAIHYNMEIKDIIFVGDKSGTKRSRLTKTSVIEEYKKVSNGAIDINTSELTNDEKIKCMKSCLKRYINGRPQFNISNDSTCVDFAKAMKSITLDKSGQDHIDNWATHVVNAAEYGVNYLFPRVKAAGVVVGLDPGEEILDTEGKVIRTVEKNITKPASAAAVIGERRIERISIFT